MNKKITVGMANYSFGESSQQLVARGLGSCLGVVLYCRLKKTGALAHVMLPDSSDSCVDGNPLRFMDKMLEKVLSLFDKRNIKTDSLEAKLVGGSDMFPFLTEHVRLIPSMGQKNIESARKLLKEKGINIVGEDVGGNHGRSLRFDLNTGIVTVEKVI